MASAIWSSATPASRSMCSTRYASCAYGLTPEPERLITAATVADMEAASGPTQPPWLAPSRAIRPGSTPS